MARRVVAVGHERLARVQQALLLASVATVTVTAWVWLMRGQHAWHAGFGSAVTMWLAMTLAMMTPAALGWLFAFASLVRAAGAVCAFAAGYFAVWLGYSAVGAGLQWGLRGILHDGGRLPPMAAGLVLIGAGAVHFTPLSRSCLQHCRNPLTYFLAKWDNGPPGGFRIGLMHGAYCVGCCWALMLTGFAMGLMNFVWMAVLTVLVCLEKLLPGGDRVAEIAAVGLMVWGLGIMLTS
jgi:predicted metal-binding membrane protein